MAEIKGIRLKVNPAGAHLHEEVGGKIEKVGNSTRRVGGRYLTLRPGQVFLHPDEARAKQLLDLRPAVVFPTTELTDEEKAHEAKTVAAASSIGNKQIMDRARALVAEQSRKLAELDGRLRKMAPADLKKEVEARKLPVEGSDNPEAMVAAILADEQAKLEAAA